MSHLSILVIEGDESLARLFSDIFKFRQWHSDYFCDSPSAIEAVKGPQHYDLIFTSYRISGSNGVEMARLIRSLDHRKDTPLVMLTGTDGIEEIAIEAGVSEIIRKPLDMHALIAAVERNAKTARSAR